MKGKKSREHIYILFCYNIKEFIGEKNIEYITYWFIFENLRIFTFENNWRVTWILAMLGTDHGYYWAHSTVDIFFHFLSNCLFFVKSFCQQWEKEWCMKLTLFGQLIRQGLPILTNWFMECESEHRFKNVPPGGVDKSSARWGILKQFYDYGPIHGTPWGSRSRSATPDQVHHSDQDFNLATGMRQGLFQRYFTWPFYLPMAIIGNHKIHPYLFFACSISKFTQKSKNQF